MLFDTYNLIISFVNNKQIGTEHLANMMGLDQESMTQVRIVDFG